MADQKRINATPQPGRARENEYRDRLREAGHQGADVWLLADGRAAVLLSSVDELEQVIDRAEGGAQ